MFMLMLALWFRKNNTETQKRVSANHEPETLRKSLKTMEYEA